MAATTTVHPDGTALTVERRYRASIDEVWATLTESDRLAGWYGTWTGDPAEGFVLLSLNAEGDEPLPPTRLDVEACEAPGLLRLASEVEGDRWAYSVTLTEVDDGTLLTLNQGGLAPASAGELAAGWAWYADRLGAAVDGDRMPTLEDFERYLPGA